MKATITYKNGNIREINLEQTISEKLIKYAQYSCDEFESARDTFNEAVSQNVIIKNVEKYISEDKLNIEYEVYVAVRNHEIKVAGKNEPFTNKNMDKNLGETQAGQGMELNHNTPYTIKLPITTGILISQLEKKQILSLVINNELLIYYDEIFNKLLCLSKLLKIENNLPGLQNNKEILSVWERIGAAKVKYEEIYNELGEIRTPKQVAKALGFSEDYLNKICLLLDSSCNQDSEIEDGNENSTVAESATVQVNEEAKNDENEKSEVKNNTEEKSNEDAHVEENNLEDEIYNM